jgi:subtilisin family serine protease
MKKIIVGSLAVAILAFGFLAVPKTRAEKNNTGKIPGQYIVVFKDNVDVEAVTNELVKNQGLGHLFTYTSVLKGFAATIPDAKLAKIKNDPRVAAVVEDQIVTADVKPAPAPVPVPTQPAQTVPTGIDRIDAENLTNNGADVTVAVIDTGIDLTHPDLVGNILGKGKSCVPRVISANDDNGHGTHVAGTIAAVDNNEIKIGVIGVAPSAKLVPVKVLDKRGSGSWVTVICGIDWVTKNADSLGIKVANMSLGGGGISTGKCGDANLNLTEPMHFAICNSSDAGVTYVVAAGNDGVDASTQVPAAYDDAVITVSALADYDGLAGGLLTGLSDDTFASFSNYGSVVDLAAPGVNIYSTWKGGTYNTISGTSMATPHVSGAAALYLSVYQESSWIEVRDGLRSLGEEANEGHTDLIGNHPEPVVNVSSL